MNSQRLIQELNDLLDRGESGEARALFQDFRSRNLVGPEWSGISERIEESVEYGKLITEVEELHRRKKYGRVVQIMEVLLKYEFKYHQPTLEMKRKRIWEDATSGLSAIALNNSSANAKDKAGCFGIIAGVFWFLTFLALAVGIGVALAEDANLIAALIVGVMLAALPFIPAFILGNHDKRKRLSMYQQETGFLISSGDYCPVCNHKYGLSLTEQEQVGTRSVEYMEQRSIRNRRGEEIFTIDDPRTREVAVVKSSYICRCCGALAHHTQ